MKQQQNYPMTRDTSSVSKFSSSASSLNPSCSTHTHHQHRACVNRTEDGTNGRTSGLPSTASRHPQPHTAQQATHANAQAMPRREAAAAIRMRPRTATTPETQKRSPHPAPPSADPANADRGSDRARAPASAARAAQHENTRLSTKQGQVTD